MRAKRLAKAPAGQKVGPGVRVGRLMTIAGRRSRAEWPLVIFWAGVGLAVAAAASYVAPVWRAVVRR